jgi:hypothetical protein
MYQTASQILKAQLTGMWSLELVNALTFLEFDSLKAKVSWRKLDHPDF